MPVHVFSTYGTDTYFVRADSEEEAKGVLWDVDTTSELTYQGTIDEVMGDDTMVKV